jgi:hypothetical protein
MVHFFLFLVADCWGRGLRTALGGVRTVMAGATGNVPNGFVKDALQVALGEGGALEVLLCLDLFCDHDGLLVLDRRHLLLPQRLLGRLVVPQIELGADEDNGNAGRMVIYLRVPLEGVSGWTGVAECGRLPLP